MSVYTPIPEDTMATLCDQFGVTMSVVKPIQNGVENSNWFITAQDAAGNTAEYVMTLFEERDVSEVQTLARLMMALDQAGLPVAAPLVHHSGERYTTYQPQDTTDAAKALQLAPRLSGTHPETASIAMCEHMGEALATLHQSMAALTPTADYTLAQYPWESVRDQYMPNLSRDDKKLMYRIWQAYERCQVDDGRQLPRGLTHGDLFLDNTLWHDGVLSGLLDFTEVSVDHLLMDIAITANDCCTDWISLSFDEAKLAALLSGYERVRALTDAEHRALSTFLAMAAVRFWVLRLDIAAQNAAHDRSGDHVLEKLPELMRDLAERHFDHLMMAK